MRVLTIVIVVLALLYGGYWFVGARAAEGGMRLAQQELRDRGLVVEDAGLAVAGFPNRFDLTLDRPQISDPASGLAWQAPFAQVFSLSYKPWHVIFALPESQQIQVAGQRLDLASTRMQGSVMVRPGPALRLRALDGVMESVSLRSDLGWALGMGQGNLRLAENADGSFQLALRALDVVPDAALARVTGLPDQLQRADLLADVTFDVPPALRDSRRPQVQRVDLREAHLIWGAMQIRATGSIVPDPEGRAEGRIDLEIQDWPRLVAAMRQGGMILPAVAGLLSALFTQAEATAAVPGTITVALTFQNGLASIGPLPMGFAPLLR